MSKLNNADLDALYALLTSGRLMTAAQIVIETGWGKTATYKRLRQLRERGHALVRKRVREGAAGPKAFAYAIARRGR